MNVFEGSKVEEEGQLVVASEWYGVALIDAFPAKSIHFIRDEIKP